MHITMSKTFLEIPYHDEDRAPPLGGHRDTGLHPQPVPQGQDHQTFADPLPMGGTLPASATELARGISLSDLLNGVSHLVAASSSESVWVRVEVASARIHTKGHVYLELVEHGDRGEQVAKCQATIWKHKADGILSEFERITGAQLAAGIKLLARARPVFHVQHGFHLRIDAIDVQYTVGDLEVRKRDIRKQLQDEGVFDLNRRLSLPWDYRHVLVVAPQSSAGLGDFQAEANRLQHHGVCQFFYVHSVFQGQAAPEQIRHRMLAALERIASSQPWTVDSVVIIRGGGADSDLAWLNDCALARTICMLGIPVLTGIGHERDSTLLDEVARQSLGTPSKVMAEIERVIRSRTYEAQKHFHDIERTACAQLAKSQQDCDRYQQDIARSAQDQLALIKQKTEVNMEQVRAGSRQALQQSRIHVLNAWNTVKDRCAAHVKETRRELEIHRRDVASNAQRQITQLRETSQAWMREIAGQSPQRTLERGFALVRDSQGRPITRANAIDPQRLGSESIGDIRIQFADGAHSARLLPSHQPETI